MLSIIIPTKNEEHYLPLLLNSIKRQKYSGPMELIVADAGSTDKTVAIAKKFGAKVVKGGHPGVGRNAGAKVAKGELFLFLDADVVLPPGFLKRNLAEFTRRDLGVASTYIQHHSKKLADRFIHKAWNFAYIAFSKIWPFACGFHIFVKREWFERVKGFDTTIYLGEDQDFIRRTTLAGASFGILKSVPIEVTVRRLDREGRVVFVCKMCVSFIYTVAVGSIRSDFLHYKLGDYPPPPEEEK